MAGAALLVAGVAIYYFAGPRTTIISGQTDSEPQSVSATAPSAGLDAETLGGAAFNGTAMVDGSKVLAERQTMLSNGDVESRRLVQRTGKYPNRIVTETLRQDPDQRKLVPVGRMEMVADHVLVHLREGSSADELKELVAQYNATVVRTLSDGDTFIVRLEAPGLDAVEQAVEYFAAEARSIAYAEPDYVRHLTAVPNDTMYGNLWGMPKISMPDAWDITTGSSDAVVAVIDTGMDLDHPDLEANLWINSIEIPGDGKDNDGNGYVDDINGWDFVSDDDDPNDSDGHGTHCAGTIGAVGNNANQVVGVCWTASIMPVRVGTEEGLLDSDIVDGIRYAARNGAKVLSNSYGGTGYSQTIYDAVEYANEQGCIFVAAAGNDSSDNDSLPQYPASYDLPNVIAVAATDENDNLATFSNYGANSVDLAAPGVNIVSTYLDGGTETLQGTSMACPHVAGAMTLLISLNADISPAEAKQVLLDSVDELPVLAGKVVSGGRMNVFAMFASASDSDKDGIPDSWEENYGLDPNNPLDALLDGDNDFLTNLEEYQSACIPNDPDSDDDSLIDGWEIRYGFNPRDVMGTLPKLQYLGFNSQCLDTYDVVVANGYAYVADGGFGLKILSLSQPENPELVGSYSTSGSVRGVRVDGDYAYVADAENGFFVVDVSDPTDPVLLSSVSVPASKVDVGGGFAYLASVSNGLTVVDISNPSSAYVTASFSGNGDPNFKVNDVALVGGSVYMAMYGGLGKIATSAKSSTYSAKSIADGDGNRNCAAVFAENNKLYVALQEYGALVYNAAKTKLGGTDTPGSAEDVAYFDGLLYMADGAKGLRIMDASDLSDITPYTHYANIEAYGVTIANGYAYVAGKGRGLHVFRCSIDSDEDGMYDNWEIVNFGNLDQSYTNDFDSDGIINWGEYLANLDPANPDQDADGLEDGYQEVQIYLTDPRTSDTDGDGLSDHYEVTTNGVDNLYLTDPLEADTDGDGMSDQWEIDNGLNPLVDDAANDPDSDGATNLEESLAGTDPANPDTDNDAMPDGWEIDNGLNPLVDDAQDDPDGDNSIPGLDLSNLGEYALTNAVNYPGATNPNKADSDDDLLGDNWEITNDFRVALSFNGMPITNMYITDPNNPDTDGDLLPDGWEETHYLNPLDDGTINTNNGAFGDHDGDGLSNYQEYLNGSDPDNVDTDGDGFSDDWEFAWGTQATNASDPVVVNDDGPYDWYLFGGQPQDPQLSDPSENGSIDHPFDAIQEAINVASNGYTILIQEGQYYGVGNRDINPGTLQLRILAENTNDVSRTIVKSHGLGAGFIFEGGQGLDTVLRGVTIQTSLENTDCSDGSCGEEHGIVCRDATSPTIADCIVQTCRDDAIYCEFNSSPVITNCVITNIVEGVAIRALDGSTPRILDCTISYAAGGIIVFDSSGLEIRNTVIEHASNIYGIGRGIWLVNDPSAQIIGCTVSDCQGGIRCENSSPTIDQCSVTGNYAPDYYTYNGVSRMASTNIAELANLIEDMVDETHDDENGGGILLLDGSLPLVQNCVIAGNRTSALDLDYPENKEYPDFGLGGGIYVGSRCSARTINCTLAENLAMTRGGGITSLGNFVEYIRNTIIWTNYCNDAEWLSPVRYEPGDDRYNSLHCRQGSKQFDPWYCDISDGYGFVVDRFNTDATPNYVGGGNYHLLPGSPCVDKGTYYSAPLYDIEDTPRPLDGDADTNTYYTVDIGAYEYVNPSADTDSDGVLDTVEIANGTDPRETWTTLTASLQSFVINYGLTSFETDSDGDGLTSYQEFMAGYDPTNSDTDGDLSPDGDEVIAGTSATDPTSYFYVSDIQPSAEGGCDIVFDSVAGRYYTVYYCTEIGGTWQQLIVDEPGDGNPMVIVDPNSDGCRFYKVEVRN